MNDPVAERLERLFGRYSRLYWNGKLPKYRMVRKKLDGASGMCDSRRRIIWIDVSTHTSARGVRSTVLHEMSYSKKTI